MGPGDHSRPDRLINGPAGAIGASIPFAIAAKAARPEATVVAVLGDGSFGFHMAEFDTAVRCGLPFVADRRQRCALERRVSDSIARLRREPRVGMHARAGHTL